MAPLPVSWPQSIQFLVGEYPVPTDFAAHAAPRDQLTHATGADAQYSRDISGRIETLDHE